MDDLPWLELIPAENGWQAIFACQVCVQSFAEVQKLRWGFNAAVLLVEALDRQKLFLESQFHGNPLEDIEPEGRALALRAIRIPETGLLLALVGKKSAASPDQARQSAIDYCDELVATFPYDYKIHPAVTQKVFEKLTGKNLLATCQTPPTMAQILRFETALRTPNTLAQVNGCWGTSDRSDEQIWRKLGNHPQPAMLNISLRPASLDYEERQALWEMQQVHNPSESLSPAHPSQPFDKWAEPFITRRLNPWKHFYLVQVHLLAPAGVTDSLIRPIASAMTRESPELQSPGFIAHYPANESIAHTWSQNIAQLVFSPTRLNQSSVSRLSDLADLNEAHSVFRFPYPPEAGLPGVKFIDKLE